MKYVCVYHEINNDMMLGIWPVRQENLREQLFLFFCHSEKCISPMTNPSNLEQTWFSLFPAVNLCLAYFKLYIVQLLSSHPFVFMFLKRLGQVSVTDKEMEGLPQSACMSIGIYGFH